MRLGDLRERLAIQRNDPPTILVTTLTRSGTTATATTNTAHGFVATDWVTIAGASPSGYNGTVKIVSAPTTTTFTFTVANTLTTPATGTITAIYTSNAQGGQGNDYWRTFTTIWGEMVPVSAAERLQLQAVQSDTIYHFRVRMRTDLSVEHRVQWRPRWPQNADTLTFAITGVKPEDATMAYSILDLAAVSTT